MSELLSPFKQRLQSLFKQGLTSRSEVDQLLDVAESNADDDLAQLSGLADSSSLDNLAVECASGRLTPRSYSNCIVTVLFGIHGNQELLASPRFGDEQIKPVSRTMRRFDYGELRVEQIGAAVSLELRRRASSVSPADDQATASLELSRRAGSGEVRDFDQECPAVRVQYADDPDRAAV